MKIALRNLGPRLAIICDLLGFLALSLTPDVERVLFLAPLGIGLLRYAKSVFLRDRLLLLFFTFLVLFGYATAAGAPTGTFMARAIIPAHAFLWLAKDEVVYRFWRDRKSTRLNSSHT